MNQFNARGSKHGHWKSNIGDTYIHDGSYLNGKKHGPWKSTFAFSDKLSWTGFYKMDMQVGFWKKYQKGKLYKTLFYI